MVLFVLFVLWVWCFGDWFVLLGVGCVVFLGLLDVLCLVMGACYVGGVCFGFGFWVCFLGVGVVWLFDFGWLFCCLAIIFILDLGWVGLLV